MGVRGHETTYRNPAKARVFVIAGTYVVLMMVALLLLSDADAVAAATQTLGLVLGLWSTFRLSPCRVEALDGSIINAFGIQHSTWAVMRRSRRTPEAAMIDELNERLSARAARSKIEPGGATNRAGARGRLA